MTAVVAILCGAVVGFSLGLVGGGGSILATPLLLYGVGVGSPHVAIGTGAVAVAVAALFNFASYAWSRCVRWRSAILFAMFGVVGALVGSTLGKAFDGQRLLLLFGLMMLVVGATMFRSQKATGEAPDYGARSGPAVAGLALAAGGASGFFGIGGGFLIVPCLFYAARMPMIHAVGSSLLAVTAFSLATAANYARSGLVDWRVAGFFIVGGLAGGLGGTATAKQLAGRRDALRRILGGLILVVAAYVIGRGIAAFWP